MADIQWSTLLPDGWLDEVQSKLEKKMRFASQKADQIEGIPYTTKDGEWVAQEIDWWTNGFWGAEMWQMFLMTGDASYRNAAVRAEEKMDKALANVKRLDHDMGFEWLIQSGVRYALEKNQDSYDRTYYCANMLAGRFNPNGFIRAWNTPQCTGWAIIDCMMNLPLLYWASRQTNDPRFKLIAMRHADMAMEYFIRPDGSSNHIVCFDAETGEFQESPGGQGYEAGSSWSRGQGWALYGFTLSYLMTGKKAYLDTAVKVANYAIASVQHTDWLAACDFRAPLGKELLDNAGGAIIASGLLQLAKCLPEHQQKMYAAAACNMLVALEKHCADWSEAQPAILTECAGAYNSARQHHMTMNYADYYFIEAVHALLGNKMLFWAPDMEF